MAVDKQPLTAAGQQADSATWAADQQQATHQQPAAAPDAATADSLGSKCMRIMAHNLHYVTFLPLILISVLQSINILVAAVVSTAIVCLLLLLSFWCYKAGHVKVFPKPYDLFNLALYGSMIILAIVARDWLLLYIGVLTNAGNACFMWATIAIPCIDNFVMHSVRDRVPDFVARLPLMRRMALLIALTWASALTIMTAGSAMIVHAKRHHVANLRAVLIAANVLAFAPLLLALPIQLVISHVYRKRMMLQKAAHDAEVAAAAAAAAQGKQPDLEAGGLDGDSKV